MEPNKFKRILWIVITPIKGLNYFVQYHRFLTSINEWQKCCFIKMANLILFCHAIHSLYLSAVPMTELEHTLHHDGHHMLLSEPILNTLTGIFALMIIFINMEIFVNPNLKLHNILYQILIEKESNLFVWKREHLFRKVENVYLFLLNLFISGIPVYGK